MKEYSRCLDKKRLSPKRKITVLEMSLNFWANFLTHPLSTILWYELLQFSNMSKLVQTMIWMSNELLQIISFSNMSKLVLNEYDTNCYDSQICLNMSRILSKLHEEISNWKEIPWITSSKSSDQKLHTAFSPNPPRLPWPASPSASESYPPANPSFRGGAGGE